MAFEALFGGGSKKSSLFKEGSKFCRAAEDDPQPIALREDKKAGKKHKKSSTEENDVGEGARKKRKERSEIDEGKSKKAKKKSKIPETEEGGEVEDPEINETEDESIEVEDVASDELVEEENPPSPSKKPGQKKRLSKKECRERREVETEKLGRTIFVGNLENEPRLVKKLKNTFKQFGAIESARVRSGGVAEGSKFPKKFARCQGAIGKQGTCNGYVVFKEKDSVKAALGLNMTKIAQFGDRHIRVDKAAPPAHEAGDAAGFTYDPDTSVFIHNLPPEVTDEDVVEYFNSNEKAADDCKGKVEAVRLIRDHRLRVCKGIGYVKLKSRKAAKAALELHKSTFMGRSLKVNPVKTLKNPKDVKVNMKRYSSAWEGVRTKGRKKLVKTTAGSHPSGGSKNMTRRK
ncbi:hypothetical protein BSKO_07849 [Bryopsis sp. KO-2023]|nr:hypothetical protein BSKO_07849 [Bryopsis sp. KO-2023]